MRRRSLADVYAGWAPVYGELYGRDVLTEDEMEAPYRAPTSPQLTLAGRMREAERRAAEAAEIAGEKPWDWDRPPRG